MNNDILIQFANSFDIDPVLDVTLEKRSENIWAVVQSQNTVLVKNEGLGSFESEPMPSSRSEEFVKNSRFDSIQEAIMYYHEWRRNHCFIIYSNNKRWNWYTYSDNIEDVLDEWDYLEKMEKIYAKSQSRNRHGMWMLIGKNYEIVKTYKSQESSEVLEFEDKFAELMKSMK